MRFLALSVSDAAEDVIAVIRAGARGYVTKTISGAELTAAIERVATGDADLLHLVWPASSSTPSAPARRSEATRARRAHPAPSARCCKLIARGYVAWRSPRAYTCP